MQTAHLEPLFIAALSALYDDRESWWHALVRDEDVFIAIRSNTINAYAGGASIARIGWNNGLQLRVAPSDDEVGSVGRVDIVAINDGGHVTLTEAKLYSNSEIRSKTEPTVCTQLVEYYNWARDHASDIIGAYTDVQDYRRQLRLRLASESIPKVVDLDVIPRLIIFGFDSTQKSQIPGIKNKIVEGLRGRIPQFQETHIRAVGNPTNIGAHHLQ